MRNATESLTRQKEADSVLAVQAKNPAVNSLLEPLVQHYATTLLAFGKF